MALLTTTIGAYAKPDYVTLPDWFKTTPDLSTPYLGRAGSDISDRCRGHGRTMRRPQG
jgi:hypothetical protein